MGLSVSISTGLVFYTNGLKRKLSYALKVTGVVSPRYVVCGNFCQPKLFYYYHSLLYFKLFINHLIMAVEYVDSKQATCIKKFR